MGLVRWLLSKYIALRKEKQNLPKYYCRVGSPYINKYIYIYLCVPCSIKNVPVLWMVNKGGSYDKSYATGDISENKYIVQDPP